MEEDSTVPRDSAQTCNMPTVEGEKVKDFVYQHFKDMADGSLFNNVEQSTIKDHGNLTEMDKETLHKTHCRAQLGAVFSGKILSFGCSVCPGNGTFSPNDLLKHFQAVHEGTPPTYPCDLCDFVTHEFRVLQRHRIEHRNTLVTCELCNDDAQYSLLLLTRHYIMCHSVNGQFKCDWCEFSTMDAGTFVQHIHLHNEIHWKCSECRHISLCEADHKKHISCHSGTFPFKCYICGFGASKSESLNKHKAACHQEVPKRSALKTLEDGCAPSNSSTGKKLLPRSKNLSGSLSNLITSQISLEETHRLIENCKLAVANVDNRSWTTQAGQQECDNLCSSDTGSHTNGNGLAVLMVKNKISLPPNCTTKVMGFKTVCGKKHLVLKVIPTARQDPPALSPPAVECVRSSVLPPVVAKSEDPVEIKQCPEVESSTSHCRDSPSKAAACKEMDQDDILAVKVKIEEDETPVYNLNSTPRRDSVEEQHSSQSRTVTFADTLFPATNNFNDGEQSRPDEKPHVGESLVDNGSVPPEQNVDATSLSCANASHTTIMCKGAGVDSDIAQETLVSKPILIKTLESCGAVDELLAADGDGVLGDQHPCSPGKHNPCLQITPQKQDVVWTEVKHQNGVTPSSQLLTSLCCRDKAASLEKGSCHLPNQEVFTFHNYSKETFSTLPHTTDNMADCNSKHSADEESLSESPHFSLALAESPEQFTEGSEDDLEVDECLDNSLAEENPDSVLQDFNIIKIEEESIPISKNQPEMTSGSTSLGHFVEEPSGPVITETINSDRSAANASSDPLKQTKTTLSFFHLPDDKKPVRLRASESILSRPEQVKGPAGFKLISNTSNPQINVTFAKPCLERSNDGSGATLTPKSGTAEKGPSFLSPVGPGFSTTSNHYLFSGQGFKGPVLLSSTPHDASTDKGAKSQPTCYLVQRSAPFVQAPSSPLKLGATRPVLAMTVGSTDKPNALQSNRQAFLLRYISPPKSGQLPTSQEAKTGSPSNQTTERSGNKVIFKIVSPTGSLLKSGAPAPCNQPLFLATRPQTQCFLLSSNKNNASASNNVKKLVSMQNTAQRNVGESCISASQMNVKVQPAAEKPILAPRPIRPPSQRKRSRKMLFDELPLMGPKARRLSNRTPLEKETTELWTPVAKEVERTLRLTPFSPQQTVKCPRRYQPVVVLNHPDADIPEVADIMKVVSRYKGDVTKVSLSQKTIQSLSVFGAPGTNPSTKGASSPRDDARPGPVQSSVRERFLLKMKLRKKTKKKYEVVKSLSGRGQQPVFSCWFCGRLFSSQEDWIGHGQRHLMEATRDWNKLF